MNLVMIVMVENFPKQPINTKTNCLCKSSKEQICNTQRDDLYDIEFDEDDERKDRDENYQ